MMNEHTPQSFSLLDAHLGSIMKSISKEEEE